MRSKIICPGEVKGPIRWLVEGPGGQYALIDADGGLHLLTLERWWTRIVKWAWRRLKGLFPHGNKLPSSGHWKTKDGWIIRIVGKNPEEGWAVGRIVSIPRPKPFVAIKRWDDLEPLEKDEADLLSGEGIKL